MHLTCQLEHAVMNKYDYEKTAAFEKELKPTFRDLNHALTHRDDHLFVTNTNR